MKQLSIIKALCFKQRCWKVPKEPNLRGDQALSTREMLLEARIKQLESSLSSFRTIFDPTIRGKGRGKKSGRGQSSTRSNSLEPLPSTSVPKPNRRGRAPSIESDLWTDDLQEDEETFHLKNVEVILNGTPIDQVTPRYKLWRVV